MMMDEMAMFLKTNNWIEVVSCAIYRKNQHELVFDTSNYVEVYLASKRVCEGRVNSVKELATLLANSSIN